MSCQNFLLIGQSNMAGRGELGEVPPIQHPQILMFCKEKWQVAQEPLHTDKTTAGIGIGMSFAEEMRKTDSEAEIGLVPCAVGGTPLSRWMPGNDLYENAVSVAKQALSEGSLRGILWHQGEADSQAIQNVDTYGQRLSTMIANLRQELDASGVPFISGELGHFLEKHEKCIYFKEINKILRELDMPCYGCVDAHGLTDKGDDVHFDSASLREFGRRYARKYLEIK